MQSHELFIELYGRISEHVRDAVEGLELAELVTVPEPGANSIAWLVWHLTRVQDGHLAELLEAPQVWVTGDWADRFDRAPDPGDTGFGHSPSEVAALRPDRPETLIAYYDAVAARTRDYLATLDDEQLDRVIDHQWQPPVTVGVRLVSIADDDIQHAGQAKYLRGLLVRRRP